MSEKKPAAQPQDPEPGSIFRAAYRLLSDFVNALINIVRGILTAFTTLIYLMASTITTLVPSGAFSVRQDDSYNDQMLNTFKKSIDEIKLDDLYETVMLKNWLEQITWSNNRANRERNANEIIRWWQILVGVLIPALSAANVDTRIIFVIGTFAAFLTAYAQFRRPEENWRHYRLLCENYKNEMWNFITLAGEAYTVTDPTTQKKSRIKRHNEAFYVFHERMSRLHEEEVSNYFKDIGSNLRPMNMDELKKQISEMQEYLKDPANKNATATTATGTSTTTGT